MADDRQEIDEPGQELNGQVVHAKETEILESVGGVGLPRSGKSGDEDDLGRTFRWSGPSLHFVPPGFRLLLGLHSSEKRGGGIVTAGPQEEILGRELHQEGHVPARGHGKPQQGYGHIENGLGLPVQPETVVGVPRIPFLEVDDEIDGLLGTDRGDAVEILHIEDAQAADFHVVPGGRGGGPQKAPARGLDIDGVIGDQPVAAIHEFEAAL